MTKNLIILFQKNLIPGQVKTRLAKTLGDTQALDIYSKLVNYTHLVVSKAEAKVVVFFSDEIDPKIEFEARLQEGKDLGEKMKNAFQWAFDASFSRVLILGTDCADLRVTHLQQAFVALEDVDAVLGPAQDGGYYLLGLSKFYPSIFEGISWSSDQVFEQTSAKLKEQKAQLETLETLYDVDEEQDWERVKWKFETS
ncbi:TIGR04282 family arsenosugar biosynthesis glycosyltransferase [Algoriphagus namhaensis]